jgi:hypothetical protein
MIMLEGVVLAGVAGVLDTKRARHHLLAAGWLLIVGTSLTVLAGLILTHWGGFPALMVQDYAQVVLRGCGYSVVLMAVLMLPRSRAYGRSLREQVAAGMSRPWLASQEACGLLYIVTAIACAVSALVGSYLPLPAWYLIRWVLIGWSLPAVLVGLAVCTGGRGASLTAYGFGLVGLLLLLACWGLPFAIVGPPAVLKVLLPLLAVYLITLGRLRECLAVPDSEAGVA